MPHHRPHKKKDIDEIENRARLFWVRVVEISASSRKDQKDKSASPKKRQLSLPVRSQSSTPFVPCFRCFSRAGAIPTRPNFLFALGYDGAKGKYPYNFSMCRVDFQCVKWHLCVQRRAYLLNARCLKENIFLSCLYQLFSPLEEASSQLPNTYLLNNQWRLVHGREGTRMTFAVYSVGGFCGSLCATLSGSCISLFPLTTNRRFGMLSFTLCDQLLKTQATFCWPPKRAHEREH